MFPDCQIQGAQLSLLGFMLHPRLRQLLLALDSATAWLPISALSFAVTILTGL
jgi:hypothetical protein